jgi:hypothetical protein
VVRDSLTDEFQAPDGFLTKPARMPSHFLAKVPQATVEGTLLERRGLRDGRRVRRGFVGQRECVHGQQRKNKHDDGAGKFGRCVHGVFLEFRVVCFHS